MVGENVECLEVENLYVKLSRAPTQAEQKVKKLKKTDV